MYCRGRWLFSLCTAILLYACFCVQSPTAADDAEITIKAAGHNADAHVHVLPDQVLACSH